MKHLIYINCYLFKIGYVMFLMFIDLYVELFASDKSARILQIRLSSWKS